MLSCFKMSYLLLLLLTNIYLIRVYADIYAATAELEYLVRTRQEVMNDLRIFVHNEEKKLLILKRYFNLYKRENEKAMKNVTNYMSNPINAFITVKSLVTDLKNIEHLIKTVPEQKVILKHEDLVYPTMEDLKGTAQGLTRLIKLYHLNVRDLADGKLDGEALSSPMSASDCYVLGRTLFKDKNFEMAILWMKQAYRKYNEDNVPDRFTDINILEYISYGYFQQGDIQRGLAWTQKILNIEPNHKKAKQSLKGFIKRLSKKIMYPSLEDQKEEKENPSETQEDYKEKMLREHYEELCRGDIDLPIQVISRLTCRYVTETHPFLKIAPIKMEIKYLDPEVVLYHELLNDREIEVIKRFSTPRFERAKVIKSKDNIVRDSRIGKIAWFFDSPLKVLQRISDRISHITGLTMKINQSRNMQICNYGVGGHFSPHVDPPGEDNLTYILHGGRRLATVMLYMTDVARGGATVFPKLGVRIPPVKGTALVWYNLHSSGEVNRATLHGACPVLLGSKWVCTKWIYQAGQEFRKPCALKYQGEGNDVMAIPPPVLTISRDRILKEEYKENFEATKKRKIHHKKTEGKNTPSAIQNDFTTDVVDDEVIK